MNHQTFKIYNEQDFKRITSGIKVAQCMRIKSSVSEPEKVINHLEDLVVSDSLSCSFCDTVFENRAQQRLHYKLDWHRYNLKQHLHGLKSITEDGFSLLADKDDVSSISGSETESENEDEMYEIGDFNKNCDITLKSGNKDRKSEKKGKVNDTISDSSDDKSEEEVPKEKKLDTLLAAANRHTKVFFENDEGHIFSIYRCLLHNKKEVPDADNEMIAQALDSGKKTKWTIVMLGGGHFAAAIFLDGKPIVYRTFHRYTVRAKQGSAQSSRDLRSVGSHPKSAGANLRRHNENALVQNVQDILNSWSTHIGNSSLILYRAVGPFNRTILFGGKNPPFDKSDTRLRPLPFPTHRATFNEVKRVHDVLSTMEIYGSAAHFKDSFPISPRQPLRKKTWKGQDIFEDTVSKEKSAGQHECDSSKKTNSYTQDNDKQKVNIQSSIEKQSRNSRSHIDRAKPRKSPSRPLPDIVARLAQSSMDSSDHLQAFQDVVPRYMKNKKIRQKKRKERKDRADDIRINEVLNASKMKFWKACELGDVELFEITLQDILTEVKKCEEIKETMEDIEGNNSIAFISMDDVIKVVNDSNEDGNTMLHLAAISGQLKLAWSLLSIGSDPCNKNKKLQTPYTITTDKRTRNLFRRFMHEYPDKFNYTKSQIPGPLNDEIENQEAERKKQQKRIKREKEKLKKKEFEIKKQEEASKQWFLGLSDREKRAVAAERRLQHEDKNILRCFQCGTNVLNQATFEYNSNKFCSMPCLKEHRLHSKFLIQ